MKNVSFIETYFTFVFHRFLEVVKDRKFVLHGVKETLVQKIVDKSIKLLWSTFIVLWYHIDDRRIPKKDVRNRLGLEL
jgi:hypothetical protein